MTQPLDDAAVILHNNRMRVLLEEVTAERDRLRDAVRDLADWLRQFDHETVWKCPDCKFTAESYHLPCESCGNSEHSLDEVPLPIEQYFTSPEVGAAAAAAVAGAS